MDHLRLQSAFKFVAISRFGDGDQLMTVANLCLEAVVCYHCTTVDIYLLFTFTKIDCEGSTVKKIIVNMTYSLQIAWLYLHFF